jgi:glutamate--cysteine ligase catalytic subunit
VALDEENQKVRLSLAQAEILKSLARNEALWKVGGEVPGMTAER